MSWVETLPRSQQDRFMAVWFAHGASYLLGVAGGPVLILRIWLKRLRPQLLPALPRTGLEIVRALVLFAVLAMILWLRFWRSAQ
jgi:hypothetical protein